MNDCNARENPYSQDIVIFYRSCGDIDMNHFFAKILLLIQTSSAAPTNDVAHNLMECAQACAASRPHQAAQLRSAATAYLSVVR